MVSDSPSAEYQGNVFRKCGSHDGLSKKQNIQMLIALLDIINFEVATSALHEEGSEFDCPPLFQLCFENC